MTKADSVLSTPRKPKWSHSWRGCSGNEARSPWRAYPVATCLAPLPHFARPWAKGSTTQCRTKFAGMHLRKTKRRIRGSNAYLKPVQLM